MVWKPGGRPVQGPQGPERGRLGKEQAQEQVVLGGLRLELFQQRVYLIVALERSAAHVCVAQEGLDGHALGKLLVRQFQVNEGFPGAAAVVLDQAAEHVELARLRPGGLRLGNGLQGSLGVAAHRFQDGLLGGRLALFGS